MKNTVVADQLRKALGRRSGYCLLDKQVRWPRIKGPKAVRVDCKSGVAVQFVN